MKMSERLFAWAAAIVIAAVLGAAHLLDTSIEETSEFVNPTMEKE